MERRGQGYKPKLIFTSDFHELVNGDLIPGPCLLRYDLSSSCTQRRNCRSSRHATAD